MTNDKQRQTANDKQQQKTNKDKQQTTTNNYKQRQTMTNDKGADILEMIIRLGRPLANNHLEGHASFK